MQKKRGSLSRSLSLRQEIEREAQEIEKEMKRHPELDGLQVTEEMDAALLKKIQAYEEELEEEREAVKRVEENLRRGHYLSADEAAERAAKDGTGKGIRHFKVPGDSVEFAAELMPEIPERFILGSRKNGDARGIGLDGIEEPVVGYGLRPDETAAGYRTERLHLEAPEVGYAEKARKTSAGYGESLNESAVGYEESVKAAAAEGVMKEPGLQEAAVPGVTEGTADGAGERKVLYRRKKRKYLVVSLAAVLVIVMGVGVTSVGSKSHWKVLWERVTGGAPMNVTNTEDMDNHETKDVNEMDVYREIEDKFHVQPVRIKYTPAGMKIDKSEIQEDVLRAQILYKYKGEIIRYNLYLNDADSSWGENEEDNKIDKYVFFVKDVEIKVEEFAVPDSSENRQIANFEYKGVHYQLKGIMEKAEFNKILENLHFF